MSEIVLSQVDEIQNQIDQSTEHVNDIKTVLSDTRKKFDNDAENFLQYQDEVKDFEEKVKSLLPKGF